MAVASAFIAGVNDLMLLINMWNLYHENIANGLIRASYSDVGLGGVSIDQLALIFIGLHVLIANDHFFF